MATKEELSVLEISLREDGWTEKEIMEWLYELGFEEEFPGVGRFLNDWERDY